VFFNTLHAEPSTFDGLTAARLIDEVGFAGSPADGGVRADRVKPIDRVH
jgi:hypothetical protein